MRMGKWVAILFSLVFVLSGLAMVVPIAAINAENASQAAPAAAPAVAPASSPAGTFTTEHTITNINSGYLIDQINDLMYDPSNGFVMGWFHSSESVDDFLYDGVVAIDSSTYGLVGWQNTSTATYPVQQPQLYDPHTGYLITYAAPRSNPYAPSAAVLYNGGLGVESTVTSGLNFGPLAFDSSNDLIYSSSVDSYSPGSVQYISDASNTLSVSGTISSTDIAWPGGMVYASNDNSVFVPNSGSGSNPNDGNYITVLNPTTESVAYQIEDGSGWNAEPYNTAYDTNNSDVFIAQSSSSYDGGDNEPYYMGVMNTTAPPVVSAQFALPYGSVDTMLYDKALGTLFYIDDYGYLCTVSSAGLYTTGCWSIDGGGGLESMTLDTANGYLWVGNGAGTTITVLKFTPPAYVAPTVPTPPTGLHVTASSNTTVTLGWVNPTGFALTANTVYQYTGSSCGGTATTYALGVVVTKEITGLSRNTEYCFYVTVGNAVGPSAASNIVTFTTPTFTPTWEKVPHWTQLPAPCDGGIGTQCAVNDPRPFYDNEYNSTFMKNNSMVGCQGACMSVTFSGAQTQYTNETQGGGFGQTLNILWSASYLPSGTAVSYFVVYEGVSADDCSVNAAMASIFYWKDGGVWTGYNLAKQQDWSDSGTIVDLNSTGDSIPFYAENSTGSLLIAEDTSPGNSNSTTSGWTFHNVPSETQFCVAMYDYKPGGKYLTNGTIGSASNYVGVDLEQAVSPGWNSQCSTQAANSWSEPACSAHETFLTALGSTTASVKIQWPGWLSGNFYDIEDGSTLNVAVYQWMECTTDSVSQYSTSGAMMVGSATPDNYCYLGGDWALKTVYSTSYKYVSANFAQGMFWTINLKGLTVNTEYAVSTWMTTTSANRACMYGVGGTTDPDYPQVCVYETMGSGSFNFQTTNPIIKPPVTSPAMLTMTLANVDYRSFNITTTATRTTSMHIALWGLASSDGIYTSVATQTPCTGYGGYTAYSVQTISGNGNTTFQVGGSSSTVAGDNWLNPNATYCLSTEAYNASGASGSYLNMTIYTNPLAGDSSDFTVFSVAATYVVLQWYIGISTNSVSLAFYKANTTFSSLPTTCTSTSKVTFTLLTNVSLSATLSPGANRYEETKLTNDTYYCGALYSYTGGGLANALYLRAFTHPVITPLLVGGLAVTKSNATLIAFSWANAASSTQLTVILSVWALNSADDVCNAATVANSTVLSAYNAFSLGTGDPTSHTLYVDDAKALYTNATYCIGVANSNNTLGMGPYSLVLGKFAVTPCTSCGWGGLSDSWLDYVIIGVVIAAAIAVGYMLMRKHPKEGGMKVRTAHRRSRSRGSPFGFLRGLF